MPSCTIIGLTGPIGSGKDTIAESLAKVYQTKSLAFADAVRAEVCDAFGITLNICLDRELKERDTHALALRGCADAAFVALMLKLHLGTGHLRTFLNAPRSPRWILRQWGTEYRRSQDDAYWLKQVQLKLDALPEGTIAVITDVRFPNESGWLAARPDAAIWESVRPGCAYSDEHQSNMRIPEQHINQQVNNDGTLDELYAEVAALFMYWTGTPLEVAHVL